MTDQDWPTQLPESGNIRKDLQVVLRRLAKANTRINHDPLTRNPCLLEGLQSNHEVLTQFGHNIVIMRSDLHGLGGPLNVHANHPTRIFHANFDHAFVETQSRDVIDNPGS